MLAFLDSHAGLIGWAVAVCGWLFSGLMSSIPPLPENCSYFVRWAHDWLQFLAANRKPNAPQP